MPAAGPLVSAATMSWETLWVFEAQPAGGFTPGVVGLVANGGGFRA